MARSAGDRAKVYVMLWTGDSPRHVAKETGVPLTTVRRWRKPAFALLRQELQQSERGRELLQLAQRFVKMAPKKEGSMKETTLKRLERQEERLRHLNEPDGVIIYDPATGQPLKPIDPRLYEGDGVIIWIPDNGRGDYERKQQDN